MTGVTSDVSTVVDVRPATEVTVLVVDDSLIDARIASAVVERMGLRAVRARDGQEALETLGRFEPALVLTDLKMPRVDGLELVRRAGDRHPAVPVVLMTSEGSEKAALEALRAGAAGYVPKSVLFEQLPATIERVLTASAEDRRRKQFLAGLSRLDCELTLANDEALVPVFVRHFQEHLTVLGLCDARRRVRAGVALEEALLNGIQHGNLEMGRGTRAAGDDAFRKEAQLRKKVTPYRDRVLTVRMRMDRDEARVVVRDQGPGFDTRSVPDPTDPENLIRPGGRGLLLMRSFLDDVMHNAAGNEVTLVLRRQAAAR